MKKPIFKVQETYLTVKLDKHTLLLNDSKGTLESCNALGLVIFINLSYH